jgi:hypothetical protein
VNWAVCAVCVATLVGLVVRGRARRTWSFVAYLVVTAAFGLVFALAPALLTWCAWLFKELLQSLLTLAVALEIAVRVFARTPQTARTARVVVLLVLAATAVFLRLDLPTPVRPVFTQTSPEEVAAFEAALSLLPRLAYGTAWLCAALFILATLRILPLDPLHRVITVGFGSYLCAYSVLLGPINDAEQTRLVSDVLTWSYLGVLVVWAIAAWRTEEFPEHARDVVYFFFPWLR